MEKKKSRAGVSILMVVGSIFVLIAGIIFAMNTWGMLEESTKQSIMVLVAFGCFAGSVFAETKWGLLKTAAALFYIGTAFLGLSIVIIFSNSFWYANLAMILPILLRFVRKKTGIDLFAFVILGDAFLVNTGRFFELNWDTDFILGTLVMYLFGIMFFRIQRSKENLESSLRIVFYIMQMLHVFLYICMSLPMIVLDSTNNWQSLLFVSVLLFHISIFYYFYRDLYLRILQSIILFVQILTVVNLLKNIVFIDNSILLGNGFLSFTTLAIIGIIMIFSERMEWKVIMLFGGMAYPIVQVLSNVYYPFSLVFGVSGFICLYKYKKQDKKLITLGAVAAFAQIVSGLFMFCGGKTDNFIVFSLSLLCAADLFTIGIFVKDYAIRVTLKICTMVFVEMALWFQPYIHIPGHFRMEYLAALAGIFIVLLAYICYDNSKEVKYIQFVLSAIVFASLLLWNLLIGTVVNAVILGVAALALMLFSALFGKRSYTVLSAVVLLILGVYMTRSFWVNVGWWVYMLIAGVLMIALAIKGEQEA